MKSRIKIKIDDEALTHVAYSGEGYDTLCGIDGNDEGIGHSIEDTHATGRVDCEACKRIATEGRQWKASDFI